MGLSWVLYRLVWSCLAHSHSDNGRGVLDGTHLCSDRTTVPGWSAGAQAKVLSCCHQPRPLARSLRQVSSASESECEWEDRRDFRLAHACPLQAQCFALCHFLAFLVGPSPAQRYPAAPAGLLPSSPSPSCREGAFRLLVQSRSLVRDTKLSAMCLAYASTKREEKAGNCFRVCKAGCEWLRGEGRGLSAALLHCILTTGTTDLPLACCFPSLLTPVKTK